MKLDHVFTNILEKVFKDKAEEFCLSNDVLKNIYKEFGAMKICALGITPGDEMICLSPSTFAKKRKLL